MRYLGGKARAAKWLKQEILQRRTTQSIYIEPFVGGGSALEALAPSFEHVLASDIVPDLIDFWNAVTVNNWIPPDKLDRELYNYLRTSEPSALRAWAGYAASYNGKWFSGYGPEALGKNYHNYLAESQRSTLRKSKAFKHAGFLSCDYSDHDPDENCIIYCDPPYANTASYAAAGKFDHVRFWRTMDQWSDRGALVFVSEYSAPKHWKEISWRQRNVLTYCTSKPGKDYKEILYARA